MEVVSVHKENPCRSEVMFWMVSFYKDVASVVNISSGGLSNKSKQ